MLRSEMPKLSTCPRQRHQGSPQAHKMAQQINMATDERVKLAEKHRNDEVLLRQEAEGPQSRSTAQSDPKSSSPTIPAAGLAAAMLFGKQAISNVGGITCQTDMKTNRGANKRPATLELVRSREKEDRNEKNHELKMIMISFRKGKDGCLRERIPFGSNGNKQRCTGTSNTPGFLKQIYCVQSFCFFFFFFFFLKKKKRQNVVTLQFHKKRPGHKQIMEIQRTPEVASKTHSPVKKEARWTISPEQIDYQEQFGSLSKNSLVNLFSGNFKQLAIFSQKK